MRKFGDFVLLGLIWAMVDNASFPMSHASKEQPFHQVTRNINLIILTVRSFDRIQARS